MEFHYMEPYLKSILLVLAHMLIQEESEAYVFHLCKAQ